MHAFDPESTHSFSSRVSCFAYVVDMMFGVSCFVHAVVMVGMLFGVWRCVAVCGLVCGGVWRV